MVRVVLLVLGSIFSFLSAYFIYTYYYIPPTTLPIISKSYPEKADYIPEYAASGKYSAYSVTNRIGNETSGSIDVYLVDLMTFEKKQIDHLERKFAPNISGLTTGIYWIELPMETQDQDVLLVFDNRASIPHLCKEYVIKYDGTFTTRDFSTDDKYVGQMYDMINYGTNSVNYPSTRDKLYYKNTFKESLQDCSFMLGDTCTYALTEVYNQRSQKLGQIVIPKSSGEEIVWGSSNRLFIRFPQKPLWDVKRVHNYYEPIIYYTQFKGS